MPRVDTPFVETLTTLDHWLACGGHEVTAEAATTTVRTVVDGDTVSRVRPEPPLWRYPTALGPYYTKERNACLIQNSEPWYTATCSNGLVYPGYKRKRKCMLPDFYPTSVNLGSAWAHKARQKILDAYVNVGVDVAEYKQTLDLVRESADLLKSGWVRYVAKKSKKARRRLNIDDVAAVELVSAYGIAPILGTTHEVLNKLQAEVKVPRIRRIVVTDTSEAEFSETIETVDPPGAYTFTGNIKRSKRAILYVQYRWSETSSGLTLGNPLSALWELTPFSFVVDWVLEIGPWLAGLSAMTGVDILAGTLGSKTYFTAEANWSGSDWEQYRPGKVEQSTAERSLIYNETMPYGYPPLGSGLSLKRTLNAISLLGVVTSAYRRNERQAWRSTSK